MSTDFINCKGWSDPALFDALLSETQRDLKAQLTWSKGWPARATHDHKMARYGDDGVTYLFKDKPKPIHAWTPTTRFLRDQLEHEFSWHSNCCVVNTYTGAGDLYPHRDSQYIPQLGARPTIMAISFGAARHFLLYEVVNGKRVKGPTHRILLEPGDLFIMQNDCDERYHHAIQPEAVDGLRLSLTFRKHHV